MNIVTSAHPFADLLGLSVDSKQSGTSTCSIAFTERLLNPNNVVHGGVIYSMADTGMGGALMSLLGDGQLCATIEIKMMYLNPQGIMISFAILKSSSRGVEWRYSKVRFCPAAN